MSLAMETARQILKEASELYPTKKKLWFASLKLEESYGPVQSQARILKEAMEKSKHVLFILKYSKHLWKKLDQPKEALEVIRLKYEENPQDNNLVLAL